MKKEPTKELAVINQNNALQIKDAAWKSLSQESQKSYSYDYKLFYEVIRKDPKDITAADIQQYIKYLEDNNYKNNSISRKIASLSKMFRVMVMAGEIRVNPVEILKQFAKISHKSEHEIKNSLTMDNIKKALKIGKGENPKLAIIIRMLARSGLRISELIHITYDNIKDFDESNKIVRIVGKGRKERHIYLNQKFLTEIQKVFPIIPETKYLFYTRRKDCYDRHVLWRDIHNFFEKTIGRDVHPHTLRHSFAFFMLKEKNEDIKSISLYLGHSDSATCLNFYIDTALDSKRSKIDI
jgi:integrase/recombinase XerD